jgi:hypothetical protein
MQEDGLVSDNFAIWAEVSKPKHDSFKRTTAPAIGETKFCA